MSTASSGSQTRSSFTITRWVTLALASGAFAALNGLFAKLTTTEVTGSAATGIAHALKLPERFVEIILRAICFCLNLLSNFIMWALFTRALTAAPSTTKVSITNTSANFLVTAVLGMIVFSERVGGLWWLGAVMMGAGCILVGMRDESSNNNNGRAADNNKRYSAGSANGENEGGEEVDEQETISLREGEGEGDDDAPENHVEPYRDDVDVDVDVDEQ